MQFPVFWANLALTPLPAFASWPRPTKPPKVTLAVMTMMRSLSWLRTSTRLKSLRLLRRRPNKYIVSSISCSLCYIASYKHCSSQNLYKKKLFWWTYLKRLASDVTSDERNREGDRLPFSIDNFIFHKMKDEALTEKKFRYKSRMASSCRPLSHLYHLSLCLELSPFLSFLIQKIGIHAAIVKSDSLR